MLFCFIISYSGYNSTENHWDLKKNHHFRNYLAIHVLINSFAWVSSILKWIMNCYHCECILEEITTCSLLLFPVLQIRCSWYRKRCQFSHFISHGQLVHEHHFQLPAEHLILRASQNALSKWKLLAYVSYTPAQLQDDCIFSCFMIQNMATEEQLGAWRME